VKFLAANVTLRPRPLTRGRSLPTKGAASALERAKVSVRQLRVALCPFGVGKVVALLVALSLLVVEAPVAVFQTLQLFPPYSSSSSFLPIFLPALLHFTSSLFAVFR